MNPEAASGVAQPDVPEAELDAQATALMLGKGRRAVMDEAKGDDSNDGDSGDDDSEDGSDDSSSGDIDVGAETAEQLMTLEHELKTSPTYEKYLEYITLLRTAPGLRKRLRDAHEDMAARFPLSEELWLAWINDELAAVSGPDDVVWLLGLMRRAATRDYLAPAVWELYLEVAHDLDPAVRDLEPEGVERYRALCEEAVAAGGLHLAAGHRLWEKYRKYELEVETKLSAEKGGATAAAARQQDRVRALYQRQLQVPLLDAVQTMEEYKAWEAGHGKSVPAHVTKAADKAREAAELRAGCEAGVVAEAPADLAKLGAFLAYIKMEQNAGDVARVQVLYERAVAAFPVTHSLWLQYGQYMETHTKLPGPIKAVYDRAVRNCPWVSAVWERAIRALDRTGAEPEAVDEMYDNALKAGLQTAEDYLAVILARLDYLRRLAVAASAPASASAASTDGAASSKKAAAVTAAATAAAFAKLREAFTSATEFMMSHFPDHVDRSLSLPAYWAHCEMYVMSDVAAAREVWESALKGALGRYAEAWEAYIAMERSARMIKDIRMLYKRCYGRRLEEAGQLRLCHAWLRFEREEGSADDYLYALLKVEPILEESAAAVAAAADQAAAAAAKAAVHKAKNFSKEEMKALRQAKDPNFKKAKQDKIDVDKDGKGGNTVKRARQVEDAESGGAEHPATSKRVRMEETEATAPFTEVAAATAGAEPHDAAGMQGEGNADAEMADQDDYEAPHDEDAGGAADGGQEHEAGPGPGTTKSQGQARRPHYTDKLTVFVRGLRPEVKDGELDGFLKSHVSEGLKEVRIMRDAQTGEARGFAYVECTSREALEKVVMLNGSTFHGKSLFVAESKPPGHNGGRGFGGRGHLGGRGRFGGPPFGRGDFSGRGRGRGQGSGGASATADGDNDTEMTEAGEGATAAGGGRGGRGGGRGGRHPGLGHPTGRGSMRTHVQMSGSVPPTALVPRSVQLGAGGSSGAPGGGQPMSNDDFRRMLLDGKK